jgi:flagellar biogenesis protein FliO
MRPVGNTHFARRAFAAMVLAAFGAVLCDAAGAAEEKLPPKVISARRSRGDADVIRIFAADESKAGQPAEAEVKQTNPKSGGALSMLARTGFWLGLVVLLLCGLVALGKKFLPKSMGMFKSPAMELLGRSYLDPKRCVYLLRVGKRMLIVGGAENGLCALGEIVEIEEVEHLTALASNATSKSEGHKGGFAAALGRRLSGVPGFSGAPAARAALPGIAEDSNSQDSDEDATRRPVGIASRAAGGLDELRERVEGLKARLRTIS